jgi:hypothetical protein
MTIKFSLGEGLPAQDAGCVKVRKQRLAQICTEAGLRILMAGAAAGGRASCAA